MSISGVLLSILTVALSLVLAHHSGAAFRAADLYGNKFEHGVVVTSMALSCFSITIAYILVLLLLMSHIGDISLSKMTEGFLYELVQFMGIVEIFPVMMLSTIKTKHISSEGRNADRSLWKLGNALITISKYCNKEINTVKYIFKDDPDEPDEMIKKIGASIMVLLGAGILLNMYIFEKFRIKE